MADKTPRRRRVDQEPPDGPFDSPSGWGHAIMKRIDRLEDDIEYKHKQNIARYEEISETYKGFKFIGRLMTWIAIVLGGFAGALVAFMSFLHDR